MKKNALFTLVPLIALGFGLIFPLTAIPGHRYVSIPAAAFQPFLSSDQYMNNGFSVYNNYSYAIYYVAPVQLPQGAIVTRLTFYFYDESSGPLDWADAILFQNNNNGSLAGMALAFSDDSGISSTYDDSIDYASIDNSIHSYYAQICLNSAEVKAYAVTIEYTYPLSLPLILK
jgi:hypothetical protein